MAERGWRRLLWLGRCPACGQRFANSMWTWSLVGYPMHYAALHLGIAPYRPVP